MARPTTLYINGDEKFGSVNKYVFKDGWFTVQYASNANEPDQHTEHDSRDEAAKHLFDRAVAAADDEYSVCWRNTYPDPVRIPILGEPMAEGILRRRLADRGGEYHV